MIPADIVSNAEYYYLKQSTVRQSSFVRIAVGSYGGMHIGILPKELLRISRYVQYAAPYFIHIMDNTALAPVMEKLALRRLVCTVNRESIGHCSSIAQACRMGIHLMLEV